MATSSIGQPVVLNEERAKRLMEILSRPHKPATAPGEPLKLSRVADLKLDPKKFKSAPCYAGRSRLLGEVPS